MNKFSNIINGSMEYIRVLETVWEENNTEK